MKPVNGVNTRLVEEEYLIPVTGDGDEDEDSEATQDGAEVSEGEDQETQGEATGDEVEEDATPQPDISETLKKYQNDLNKMKSSFQRKETELLKEKSVLEEKLENLLKSTMDEKDRKQYEQDKLVEDLNKAKQEKAQLEAQLQETAQFLTWKEFFESAGIKSSELDMQNGLAGLTNSGLNAMKERLTDKGNTTTTVNTPTKKKAKNPPEVAQSSSGKLPTLGSLDDAIEHFAKGDQEKFWRMAETGNPSVLKVLNELNNQ